MSVENGELPGSEYAIEDISTARITQEWNPEKHRAHTALGIAGSVIAIFAVSVIGLLVAAFAMLWQLKSYKPDAAEQFVEKVAIPLIASVGTFESTLFGPLLAFILGFYFKSAQGDR